MKLGFKASLAAVVLAVVPACGDDDAKTMTIDTPQGKVNVTVDESAAKEGQGKMKYTSTDATGKTSTVEMSGKPNLAAFEGLVYPGAQALEGGYTMTTPEMSTSTASFTSADPVEKLTEHYKKQFPQATSFSSGPMTQMQAKTSTGADLSITIASGEGTEKTSLTLTLIKKS